MRLVRAQLIQQANFLPTTWAIPNRFNNCSLSWPIPLRLGDQVIDGMVDELLLKQAPPKIST